VDPRSKLTADSRQECILDSETEQSERIFEILSKKLTLNGAGIPSVQKSVAYKAAILFELRNTKNTVGSYGIVLANPITGRSERIRP
jgi:hypothetical protein